MFRQLSFYSATLLVCVFFLISAEFKRCVHFTPSLCVFLYLNAISMLISQTVFNSVWMLMRQEEWRFSDNKFSAVSCQGIVELKFKNNLNTTPFRENDLEWTKASLTPPVKAEGATGLYKQTQCAVQANQFKHFQVKVSCATWVILYFTHTLT